MTDWFSKLAKNTGMGGSPVKIVFQITCTYKPGVKWKLKQSVFGALGYKNFQKGLGA